MVGQFTGTADTSAVLGESRLAAAVEIVVDIAAVSVASVADIALYTALGIGVDILADTDLGIPAACDPYLSRVAEVLLDRASVWWGCRSHRGVP